jgi:site-specific DNA-methyltransferase (adenine-specific)
VVAHLAENSRPLTVRCIAARSFQTAAGAARGCEDACLLVLPFGAATGDAGDLVRTVAAGLGPQATLITLGEPAELAHAQAALEGRLRYQLWIAIQRAPVLEHPERAALPRQHFGALVHTRYPGSLRHATLRVGYSYCPACDRTTKDYGGKKHTYHPYGTLLSDVWRDLEVDPAGDLAPVIERFADLLGVEPYRELRVIDCRSEFDSPQRRKGREEEKEAERKLTRGAVDTHLLAPGFSQSDLCDLCDFAVNPIRSALLHADCLAGLRALPGASVDFAFADPPYNVRKRYAGYADDRAISEYFAWCDAWLAELARVLRPGRTLAVLNLPLWGIRHFLHLETLLQYQNWIAWDALSYPVRRVMPAHYGLTCFSKGAARPLPGLEARADRLPMDQQALRPAGAGYCLRAGCIARRAARGEPDGGPPTDLWGDIHRLKHNSRRVDHPCQLPPLLMRRLIALFTQPGEVVLDCFNGSGTTTLAAAQLGRRYLGIEASEEYHRLAEARHRELAEGLDPFRKVDRPLTAKNSPVARLPRQKYTVSKKTLQLEVRRVAAQLGRLPSRSDVERLGRYPIEYYDRYFASWGEARAAARAPGMSERRAEGFGVQAKLFPD